MTHCDGIPDRETLYGKLTVRSDDELNRETGTYHMLVQEFTIDAGGTNFGLDEIDVCVDDSRYTKSSSWVELSSPNFDVRDAM